MQDKNLIMKATEFRKLIREEVRDVINEEADKFAIAKPTVEALEAYADQLDVAGATLRESLTKLIAADKKDPAGYTQHGGYTWGHMGVLLEDLKRSQKPLKGLIASWKHHI